jgi:hypothetical protein
MNLLTNPGFNEGYYHQNDIPELAVPQGWQLYYIDDDTFPGCGNPPAYRPESVVWNIEDAPEHEKGLFFLDGDYCLKVFKAHAPLYFALTQAVSGLTPGTRYRFSAQVYPDIVKGYAHGQKVRPQDIWHAEARVGWSVPDTPWPRAEDGDVNWAKWFNVNNKNFAFGAYNEVWQEFVAPEGGEVQLWLECKAKWGDAENNWFMDAFALTLVGPAKETPPPEGKPDVTPDTEPKPELGMGRGAPRDQYARTYILLPGSFPLDMVLAAARVAYEAKATLGFAADDAGVGDLDQRRVICVSPDQIGDGLSQAWYDQYYPGVEFVAVYARNPTDLEQKLRAVV